MLAWTEGDPGAAGARLEEAAALGRTIDDLPTAAHALHFLAMVRLGEGDAATGRSLGEQAVALARKAADAFCLTIALASNGVVLLALEHYDDARAALEESVARGREGGDAWAVALPLRNLAIIAYRQQDYRTARPLLEESLHGLRASGEKWFLSRSMETLAEVMATAGEYERAAHLFGAAETLREAVGASVLAFYRADYERAIGVARTALGPQKIRVVLDSRACALAGRRGRVRARRRSYREAAAVVAAYDFAPFTHVVDVAGGRGVLLAAILNAHPRLRGTLFDRPDVVDRARETFAQDGFAGRYQIVGGDFFAHVPETGDLYVLSRVIHDWDDAAAVRILTTCRRAMSASQRLVLLEAVLPDRAGTSPE